MSRASSLGAFLFEAESSFGENVTTYANRLATIGPPDVSGLEQSKVDADRTVQYAGEYTMPIRGVMGGSFRTKSYLTGHGSTTAGAISLTALETMLGYVIGNASASASGTTVNTGGATTTLLPVAAASGFATGALISVGSLGDGGGSAQSTMVSDHSGSQIGCLALPAAPANGAVVYTMAMLYPTETQVTQAVTTTRWRILTANRCFDCHGVFPTAIAIDGLSPGEIPTVEVTWNVSWFIDSVPTFPTAISVLTHAPAPTAAGSLYIHVTGDSARETYACRSFKLNVDLGIVPVMGPGGVNAFQNIVGATRTKHTVTVDITVDSGNASTTPAWPVLWDSDTQGYQILYTANGAATGKRVAFFMPNARLIGVRPMQRNDGGLNRETLTFQASTNSAVTTELLGSSWRMGLG